MKTDWAGLAGSACLALAMSVATTAYGAASEASGGEAADPNRISRNGVIVEMAVRPVEGSGAVKAADWADVSFRISDAGTGQPIKGSYPAAWIDLAEAWEARGNRPMGCRERVANYMRGIVGMQPMIDLNSHYVVVMNRDASISVIDPTVGITGITNLFTQINLERPGADWAKTGDHKRLFVTMPLANKVARVDTDSFKVSGNVSAGSAPTSIVLQGDERYLWVGNDADEAAASGVTVIDTETFEAVKFIATGRGHHQITLSDDSRYAFVSNREQGTVSVIDVARLTKLKDIETGPLPISLAYSSQSKLLYVADGRTGEVAVIDPAKLTVLSRIALKPGLGPLRFTPDGRWALVVNPEQDAVFVIDAATNKLVHTIPVEGKPYQLSFTRQYAYVRSLATEQVGMIRRSSLGGAETPRLSYFPAGALPPGLARDIGIADSMVPAPKHAAVFVMNPAQGTIYYYMEGMGAPMGGYRNYGHEPRAVEVVDRSLRELSPGVYGGRVRMPQPGLYDVAFIMDAPPLLHCFSAEVEPNPAAVTTTSKPMSVRYIVNDRRVPIRQSVPVRFQLDNPGDGTPLADLQDVQVLYYNASGGGRRVVPARSLGEGVYEADIILGRKSTYYLFVASASQNVRFTDLPFLSLMGVPATAQRERRDEAAR
jgi:YVTN family beta-propeller protein